MFGYVKTDMPNMYVKDTVLYKAMYCGLCKSIGKQCGLRCRFLLNYDLAFLSALMHNVLGKDVCVEKRRCIIHPIIKRPMAGITDLSERIAALNVILAYYKLCDDVADDKKGRLARSLIKKGYKRALKKEPLLDGLVKKEYDTLRALEKEKCDSVDRVSDCFANIVSGCVKIIAGDRAEENLLTLSYNVGKWIYLIDAIDDFDKDVKKKNYNVFAAMHSDVKTKRELLNFYGKEITEIFYDILGEISERTKNLKYNFNHDLTDNILLRGLSVQTKQIMEK